MDDAVLVDEARGLEDLEDDLDGITRSRGWATGNERLERAAREMLHRDEVRAVARSVIERAHDVRMPEAPCPAGFAAEPLRGQFVLAEHVVRTLIATSSPPVRSRARYTVAVPPAPSRSSTSYRPAITLRRAPARSRAGCADCRGRPTSRTLRAACRGRRRTSTNSPGGYSTARISTPTPPPKRSHAPRQRSPRTTLARRSDSHMVRNERRSA